MNKIDKQYLYCSIEKTINIHVYITEKLIQTDIRTCRVLYKSSLKKKM